jgi:hypothetical protein
MARSPKGPFEIGKMYYTPYCNTPIKYVEQKLDGYYVFKITKDPEWDEFETKDIECIHANKTAYLRSQKP